MMNKTQTMNDTNKCWICVRLNIYCVLHKEGFQLIQGFSVYTKWLNILYCIAAGLDD